jgi:hypothetical protein
MSGATPSEFVVEPLGGGRVRLAVGDGVLVATDDRGRRHRFPLGGSEAAPAVVVGTVGVSGPGSFAVIDGAGRAMIVTPRTLWPEAEIPRLAEAAGLPYELRGGDGRRQVFGLRKDGVRLGSRSTTNGSLAAVLTPMVLLAVLAARVGWIPFWIVLVVFLACVATLLRPRFGRG